MSKDELLEELDDLLYRMREAEAFETLAYADDLQDILDRVDPKRPVEGEEPTT